MSTNNFTIGDVETGAANYMLGMLQMTVAGGDSITPEIWQKAIDETVAFQLRMAAHVESPEDKKEDRGASTKSATVSETDPHQEGDL